MGMSAKITAAVFAAYLKCPTKGYLSVHGEKPPDTFVADTRGLISAAYRARAVQELGPGLPAVVSIEFLRAAGDPAREAGTTFSLTVRPRHTLAISRSRRGEVVWLGKLCVQAILCRSSISPRPDLTSLTIFLFASVPWQSGSQPEAEFRRVEKSFTVKNTAASPSESPTTSREHDRSSRRSLRSATRRNRLGSY
jgi:hypothetical protein